MRTNEESIVVEQSFQKTVDKVWEAITDPEKMKKWYFESIPSFSPEVGLEIRFDVQSEDRTFPHIWKVTEVIPLKIIKYNWKYDGYPGNSYVVFELFEEESSTLLRLTHVVTEDFPDEIPEFKRESCLQGWTYFINTSLMQYLEK